MKERKRQPHQRTHLSQRKEVRIAFAFAFALHLSFSMVKGIKLKEKSKRKKKGVRIQAIIGQIRRDPDPGHVGPDFDSGSGLGSAFTDPGPGARLKARTFWTFCGLFGLDLYLKRSAWMCVCGRGELLLSKFGLKQEKLSVRPRYSLDCAQVYTRVEGGDRRPQFAVWCVGGLQVNRHGTSFIKINFNPRVCFAITFSHSSYGPSYVKQTLDGVKNLNDSTEKLYDNFSPV
jgi:hypothetical protein